VDHTELPPLNAHHKHYVGTAVVTAIQLVDGVSRAEAERLCGTHSVHKKEWAVRERRVHP